MTDTQALGARAPSVADRPPKPGFRLPRLGEAREGIGEGGEVPVSRWGLPDVFGLLFVVALGIGVMVPALIHGSSFGPFDILNTNGLTSNGKQPHWHNWTLGDQIRLFIPWSNQVWTQVHQGHLPLWNRYSALGLPLGFNWQSQPLALPTLVGYLFPVHLTYTVQIITTVVIAGTGAYVLGKVLGLTTLGCIMAASMFELSGPFIAWLGWPLSAEMSWAGWLFAGVVLVLRQGRRARAVVFLAVVIAFALFAGDPEGVLLLTISAALFSAVVLVARTRWFSSSGPIRRPITDFAGAIVGGVFLAAPIVLPGLQLASKSNRTAVGPENGPTTLPLRDVIHLVFQGFDGLPLLHNTWFGFSNYEETTAYVGVIGLVLAAMAIVMRWRRPEVLGFCAVIVVTGCLVFLSPLVTALDKVESIYWVLAMTPMVFGICILAGMGTDLLLKGDRDRTVRQVLGNGFAIAAALLVVVWLLGRGSLAPHLASIRAKSFIWPAVSVVVGLLVTWFLAAKARTVPNELEDPPERRPSAPRHSRRHQLTSGPIGAGAWAAVVLIVFELAFLYMSGSPLESSNSTYLPQPAGVLALKQAVGNNLVGFGVPCSSAPRVGVLEDTNIAYGIPEMAVYDPMAPQAYYSLGWKQSTGEPAGRPKANNFCPVFPTASLARQYGVAYVLVLPGMPGPQGSVYVKKIGNEELYRIPGAASAVLVPNTGGGNPSLDATGTPIEATYPSPSSISLNTSSSSPSVLRLHITNVPGWHATIDGKPLALQPYDQVMLQANIPPGNHAIELHYWPETFSIGLVLAAIAVVAGLVLLEESIRRSRRRLIPGAPTATATTGGEQSGQLGPPPPPSPPPVNESPPVSEAPPSAGGPGPVQ